MSFFQKLLPQLVFTDNVREECCLLPQHDRATSFSCHPPVPCSFCITGEGRLQHSTKLHFAPLPNMLFTVWMLLIQPQNQHFRLSPCVILPASSNRGQHWSKIHLTGTYWVYINTKHTVVYTGWRVWPTNTVYCLTSIWYGKLHISMLLRDVKTQQSESATLRKLCSGALFWWVKSK